MSEKVRYCEIEAAKKLNCLSPSTSLKVTCVPPNRSPPLVTPTLTGGRPSRNIFSKVPFSFWFSLTSVWVIGGWKSTIAPPASPKSLAIAVWIGSLRSSVWTPHSFL